MVCVRARAAGHVVLGRRTVHDHTLLWVLRCLSAWLAPDSRLGRCYSVRAPGTCRCVDASALLAAQHFASLCRSAIRLNVALPGRSRLGPFHQLVASLRTSALLSHT